MTKIPTVLVVEDDAELRSLYTAFLSDRCKVLEACNGKDGIEILEKEAVDLILSDIIMPVMNGAEMINHIHNEFPFRVPIIVLSSEVDIVKQLYTDGLIEAYLAKPCRMEILQEAVYTALKKKEPKELASILIIEDEENVRYLYDALLQDEYELDFAVDGREGFRKATSIDYDLIITDLSMPNWDGIDNMIAMELIAPGSKYIVVSAYIGSEKYRDVLERTPNIMAQIQKPFVNSQLIEAIEKVIAAPIPN